MTKTISFFLAVTFSLTSSFGQGKIAKFKIEGKVQGYSSGTMLYFHDLSDGSYKKIDSAIITNDKFTFNGRLKTKYLKLSSNL